MKCTPVQIPVIQVRSDIMLRRRSDEQFKAECYIQGPSEDLLINDTNITVKCESLEPHEMFDEGEPKKDNSLFSAECTDNTLSKNYCSGTSCEDTKMGIGNFLLGKDMKVTEHNADNVLIRPGYVDGKQIKTECSIEGPSEDPLIYDTNITVKCESLEPHDVFDGGGPKNDNSSFLTECAVDTLSKNDCCEDSCEDTKVSIVNMLNEDMNVSWKEKEQEKFNEVFLKSEHQTDVLFRREYNIVDTENASSNSYDSETSCENTKADIGHTSGNFTDLRSADVKHDKREKKKNNTSINHKEGFKSKLYQCDVCDKSFTQSSPLNIHKRTHTSEKPYKCDICGRCFARTSSLNNHKLTHTGKKQYQCDICNKYFARTSSLNDHKFTHTDERPHQCDVCKKFFTRLSHLDKHQRTHTGEKPYQCDICNKSFARTSGLNEHKFKHTGERAYQCDVCKKFFTRSSNLDKHQRIHTGEKPYKCDVCDKRFSQTSNLNIHKLTHAGKKPYRCDVCDKCFAHSGHLSEHKRTHTGEKPYKCDICEKCFSRSSNLNCHKLTHTGEKPHQCDACNMCFTRLSRLDKHKRTRHTDGKERERL